MCMRIYVLQNYTTIIMGNQSYKKKTTILNKFVIK